LQAEISKNLQIMNELKQKKEELDNMNSKLTSKSIRGLETQNSNELQNIKLRYESEREQLKQNMETS